MYVDKATQRSKILAYFLDNGSMTVRDAFEELNINSPTKRISELRRMGYDIVGIRETRIKKNGNKVGYIRYYLNGLADIPKILEGMKVSFVPGFTPFADWSLKQCKDGYIDGTITYINWEHENFAVEYDCGGTKQREAFKFSQIGGEVKLNG